MRRMSKFEKLGVVAAVIVASSFIYMKKVYEPQEKRLKTTVANLNKVIGELNNLKSIKSTASLKSELEKNKKELTQLEAQSGTIASTNPERQASELLGKVSRALERSGMLVNGIKPGGKKPDELFEWNSYEFDLNGSYFQFMQFMERLRAMTEPVKVKKLVLEQGKDKEMMLHVTLELLL
jgi:Tfp pilus assembly protein PilO